MIAVLIIVGVGLALVLGGGLLYVVQTAIDREATRAGLEEARLRCRALTAAQEIERVGYETRQAMWQAALDERRR